MLYHQLQQQNKEVAFQQQNKEAENQAQDEAVDERSLVCVCLAMSGRECVWHCWASSPCNGAG